MTIDERLEMLVQVSASHESNINRLFDLQASHAADLKRLFDLQTRNEEMQARNEELMAQVLGAINEIGRVVVSHEKRISDLEGGRT